MKFGVLLLNQILKSRDSSVIEKTIPEFCKRYLQVHNKPSNIARKAQLGKFHTIIDINKKILNYLSYLKGKDEDSAVKQALQFSLDLHISVVICISRVGEHISLARDMCFAGRKTHITMDMCFPGREQISLVICVFRVGEQVSLVICVSWVGTNITRDMCFPGRGHISLARNKFFSRQGDTYHEGYVFNGRATHITRDMCFRGRGTRITMDMCFPGRGTHISRDMCFPGGKHISLVLCVSGGSEYISI